MRGGSEQLHCMSTKSSIKFWKLLLYTDARSMQQKQAGYWSKGLSGACSRLKF